MTNRLPLALLLALTLVPVAVSVPANAEAPEKVTVCHIDGNGVYRAISISEAAYETHLNHGGYYDETAGTGVFNGDCIKKTE
jgi:hypothetical protein